jgi:protein involved in polysaccharide export with SLBB domain
LAWSKRLIAPDDLVRLHEGGEAGGLRELAVDANGKLQLTETVSIDAAGLTSYELQEQVMIKLVEAYLMDIKVEVLPAPAGDLDEAAAANGEDAPAASAPAGSDAPAAVTEGAEGQPVEPDSASLQDVTTAYDAEPAPDRVWSNRRVAPGDFVRLRLGGETGEVRELVVDSDGRLQLTDKVSTEAAGLTSYQLQEQVMVKLVEDYMSNLEVEVLPAASAEALPEAN